MTLFSLAGSRNHVNRTAAQANDLEKKMSDTSGRKCLEQFGKFNRATLWAKMFAALLIGMEGWYSTKCRLTWKLKATKCSRFYFQLVPLTHPIEGIGFGLLPTPTKSDYQVRRESENWDGSDLVSTINKMNGTYLTLNPEFVEIMMGFPKGWTGID